MTTTATRGRRAALAALLLPALLPAVVTAVATPAAAATAAVAIDWTAEPRFGAIATDHGDWKGGIVDFHWNEATGPLRWGGEGDREQYDPRWVEPEAYGLHLTGCLGDDQGRQEDGTATHHVYAWSVEGSEVVRGRTCRVRHEFPREGSYAVALRVLDPGSGAVVGTGERTVQVEDHLVVSLGDSYGSGEGNPETRIVYAPHPDGGRYIERLPRWVDRRCHRSAAAGPAQFAAELERTDARTSVTFLSFACSGATVGTDGYDAYDTLDPYELNGDSTFVGSGVTGPYAGVEPLAKGPDGKYPLLPSQVEQMRTALLRPDGTPRTVDALIVSGGGNDMGFSKIAKVCVVFRGCPTEGVDAVTSPAGSPDIELQERFARDVAGMPHLWQRLHGQLVLSGIPIRGTYLTEYPDPTTGPDGQPCDSILGDTFAGGSMDSDEIRWARGVVLPEINGAVARGAREHGWTYVGGMVIGSMGHGYCAGLQRWFRQGVESVEVQGPDDVARTTGTLHPNERGHALYAQRLRLIVAPRLRQPVFTHPDEVDGLSARRGAGGWTTGFCDAVGACSDAHGLAVVTATHPDGIATAGVRLDGQELACAPGGTCETRTDATTHTWVLRLPEGRHTVELTAATAAGAAAVERRRIDVDLVDPGLTLTSDAEVTASGWSRVPVTVTATADDGGGSGVDAVTLSLDGAGGVTPGSRAQLVVATDGRHTVSAAAQDAAGRAGRAGPLAVDVDGTAPTVGCADAPTGWQAGEVVIVCSASDATSGLTTPASFSLSTAVGPGHETADASTGTSQACDVALGCTTAGPVTGLAVDRRPPTVTATGTGTGDVALGSDVVVVYDCSDGGSGIARCAGSVPSGTRLDTSTVGRRTVTVTAADAVGNTTTTYLHYDVRYPFGGLRGLETEPTQNVVRAGAAVPLRFSLGGDRGTGVLVGGAPSSEPVGCDSSAPLAPATTTDSPGSSGLTYDAATDTYGYGWKTDRAWAGSCRRLLLALDDGSVHTALFLLR